MVSLNAKAGSSIFDYQYLSGSAPLPHDIRAGYLDYGAGISFEGNLFEGFASTYAVRQATAKRGAAQAELDALAKHRAAAMGVDFAHQEHLQVEAKLAQFGDVHAKIEAARAEVQSAELDVEYCSVYALFDAYITNLNISVGQYVQPGQKLFALVDDRNWYVIADYKETYLRHIRPGMAVDVFLAPYPGKRFRGEVQGIGWANYPDNIKEQGSLPTVERTLNWVVLASRFPVRIKLLERDANYPFRMGMTAFTTVLGFRREAAAVPTLRP